MQNLAFVRSPLAHARLLGIRKPAGAENQVFTAADLAGVGAIVANSALLGFKPSAQHALATDRVRHVGEAIAVCVASTRAAAEDLAEQVVLDLEELPTVSDMLAGREPGAPQLHPHWGDNVFLETRVDLGPASARDGAPITVRRTLRTARQHMAPIEGRGLVAHWDRRMGQLVLHSSTQMPHIVRTGLAGCLGLPEEVVAGFLARRLGRPVCWIEDRRETVSVDTESGQVRILDYAVCEDGGVLVNPMVVDGQIIGGVAQGIGTALLEEMAFDDAGQPGAATLSDYSLPGASKAPALRVEHMQTPSPYTRFGQKGIGEGGAIGPPAAIANAVNDALRPLGVPIDRLPITAQRVMADVLGVA